MPVFKLGVKWSQVQILSARQEKDQIRGYFWTTSRGAVPNSCPITRRLGAGSGLREEMGLSVRPPAAGAHQRFTDRPVSSSRWYTSRSSTVSCSEVMIVAADGVSTEPLSVISDTLTARSIQKLSVRSINASHFGG